MVRGKTVNGGGEGRFQLHETISPQRAQGTQDNSLTLFPQLPATGQRALLVRSQIMWGVASQIVKQFGRYTLCVPPVRTAFPFAPFELFHFAKIRSFKVHFPKQGIREVRSSKDGSF